MLILISMSGILSVLALLFGFIEIPSLPPEMLEYFEMFLEYLEAGAGILANYVPLGYLAILFGVILAVDIGVGVYHLIMWVIRKIPFLGME